MKNASDRGLTIADIEDRAGVSSATLYRWRDGQWAKDPRPSQVKAFCQGLGIPWESAFKVLGWTTGDEQVSAPEPVLPPEITAIMRTLNDPNVPDSEKSAIRSMLELIARQHGRQRKRAAS